MSSRALAQIADLSVVTVMGKHLAQTYSGTSTSPTRSDLVNQAGAIVQRVIGLDTAKLTSETDEHNPDKSWQEMDE